MLKIGWLFPDLMSTYGDRGNVICLKKRAEGHGIAIEIKPLTCTSATQEVESIDLFVAGGSQDREQEIVARFLEKGVGELILKKLEAGVPALFVCGSFQIMGKSFQREDGKEVKGLGFFECETICRKKRAANFRFTGPLIFELKMDKLIAALGASPLILGFENHNGATYLKGAKPLGHVFGGFGNNGEDRTEGVFHQNAIGTYAHGPLLPKNPFLADWLLMTAYEIKYGKRLQLKPLIDPWSDRSRQYFLSSNNWRKKGSFSRISWK